VGWLSTRLDKVQGVLEEVPTAAISAVAAVLGVLRVGSTIATVFCILY
jgi:hypothetical protein